MIGQFVASVFGRHPGASPGYVGRHRAPRTRYAAAVRMLPVPAPTRVPDITFGGR